MGTFATSLSNAIAQAEGYGVSGALPTLANNPGDLKLGDQGLGTLQGITIFPNAQAGQVALQNQVNSMLDGSSQYYDPSMTLSDIGQTYANGDSNWAQNVANILGTDVNTPLGQIASSSTSSPVSAISSLASSASGASSALSSITSIFNGFTLEDFVFIAVGILLIAAGLFAFKTTQNIIEVTTSAAKRAAEVTA